MMTARLAVSGFVAAAILAPHAGAQNCQWDLTYSNPGMGGTVRELMVFDSDLYAAGLFQTPTLRIGRWTGSGWAEVGAGGLSSGVNDHTVWDDGSGPALYIVGPFQTVGAGTIPALRAARWDGTNWSALGDGLGGTPSSVAAWDDGTGSALYVGGSFTTPGNRLVRWDGAGWSQVGGGVDGGTVGGLCDFQGQLHLVGTFTSVGGVPIQRAARWDGAQFHQLGTGLGSTGDAISGCLVWDDGTGEALYVWGSFEQAGGVRVNGLARWDGTGWSSVGGGATQASGAGAWIASATVFNDGAGEALYIGSHNTSAFTHAGGVPAERLARWDGSSWTGSATGPNHTIFALRGYDDGARPVLWVGGQFTSIDGQTAERIARWACDTPAPCYPDCDGNEVLDFFDFLCFQNAFLAQDPYADCDGNGVFDFFDFLCFQNEFLAGCP